MIRTISLMTLTFLAGCSFSSDDEGGDVVQDTMVATQAPAPKPPPPDLTIEVVLSQRALHVKKAGQTVATHPVAVGSEKWPTPTGEWTIGQVIFNPRWVPPEESWAEDDSIAEPGAPDNPLGVVQLVYRPPNSIHGTKDLQSLGKAVSHGSIRVSNEVGVDLAKQVMRAGGADKDDAWVQQALNNPTVRQEVAIPNPVTIRVVE